MFLNKYFGTLLTRQDKQGPCLNRFALRVGGEVTDKLVFEGWMGFTATGTILKGKGEGHL